MYDWIYIYIYIYLFSIIFAEYLFYLKDREFYIQSIMSVTFAG